ncbi:hypothetical protein LXL04_029990 [Taraxacum kok-saghyz]
MPNASGNPSVARKASGDESSKTRPIKFYLHASGNVAAKFAYDQVLVGALRKIPRATWHAKERLWMFPLVSLPAAEKVLGELSGSNMEVESLDPLLQRAISAASTVPDLQDRYESMPDCIKSKLLPFQQEGVRFILQHGGLVLLADEMGFGKTLQAIAVVSCVRDSWPVLVLIFITPSMGFCNFSLLLTLVVIADESHFLKNAQAKRTTASLPILQKARYTMLLSGTPALSRPIELFKQVFLDLADKDMKQINALFRELEALKLKIKACKSKEEGESLKFNEKHIINMV